MSHALRLEHKINVKFSSVGYNVCSSNDWSKPFNTKKIPLKMGMDTFIFENIVFLKIWLETFQTY